VKGVAALVLAPFAAVVMMMRDENWEAAVFRLGNLDQSQTETRAKREKDCILLCLVCWNLAAD